MLLTREDIVAVHDQGVDAVVALVLLLQTSVVQQQEQTAAMQVLVATQQEQMTALQQENAGLRARVKILEDQVKTNSRTSSKPPSSDGYTRPPRSMRSRTEKNVGGQPGHPGCALSMVETPDRVIMHSPAVCTHCQAPLASVAATGYERRQVVDLPALRLEVSEHRVEEKTCPQCHAPTTGTFPDDVTTTVQYGAAIRSLAVYLLTYHLLPYERTSALLGDLFGHPLAKGTLQTAVETCAAGLKEVEEQIKDALRQAPVLHNDETGVRVQGQLQWVHVTSTLHLTHYGVHEKRGSAATTAIAILPAFTGVSVHDGWSAYWQYPCGHALCNAHHLRELRAVEEHDHQPWATTMARLLVEIKETRADAQARGDTRFPPDVSTAFVVRYRAILTDGYAANPPSLTPPPRPTRRGRAAQSKALNLLDRLKTHQDAVLMFMTDWRVPFDNNQAERDLRMIKVQQKVSGCFRTPAGATAFCRIRGYLSTLKKQSRPVLPALQTVFARLPLLPDLAAG